MAQSQKFRDASIASLRKDFFQAEITFVLGQPPKTQQKPLPSHFCQLPLALKTTDESRSLIPKSLHRFGWRPGCGKRTKPIALPVIVSFGLPVKNAQTITT
jgi:hypothetical protein